MSIANYTIKHLILNSWLSDEASHPLIDWQFSSLLQPLRQWLNNIKIDNPQFAHLICHLIPSKCPFARQIKVFGHTLITIPPLCKLNPLYDELMTLRFRAICYLADECGEDISQYC